MDSSPRSKPFRLPAVILMNSIAPTTDASPKGKVRDNPWLIVISLLLLADFGWLLLEMVPTWRDAVWQSIGLPIARFVIGLNVLSWGPQQWLIAMSLMAVGLGSVWAFGIIRTGFQSSGQPLKRQKIVRTMPASKPSSEAKLTAADKAILDYRRRHHH